MLLALVLLIAGVSGAVGFVTYHIGKKRGFVLAVEQMRRESALGMATEEELLSELANRKVESLPE